jgi:putative transposase
LHKCQYHVTFATKYRKKIIVGRIRKIVCQTMIEKAGNLKITIKNIQLMSDHIHLFISINTTDNLSTIIKEIKGYSSYMVHKELRNGYKHLWGKGYYCESIGNISEPVINKYIDNQFTKKRSRLASIQKNSSQD